MEHPEALAAYVGQVSGEREKYLYQRLVKQLEPELKRLSPAERELYLHGESFERQFYHEKRRDKVYQALQRGELVQDYHRAEFEQLEPLILSELRHGGDVDLPFLRSVSRYRVTLGKAHAAVKRVEELAVRRFFQKQQQPLAVEADRRVERSLRHDALGALIPRRDAGARVLQALTDGPFRDGIPEDFVERAFRPKSLTLALQDALFKAFPELSACRNITMPGGEKLAHALQKDIRRARSAVCAEVRRRFPVKRIRRLLAANPSVSRLQRESDAERREEEALQTALLDAIPERICDLYPRARAMKRRFVLHLGPTNSGKTFDGISRLHGALHGIYLGPLRLLAAEQFDTLNLEGIPCSLVTGEERILVPFARVQSSTVEMADLKAHYDVAVIDECQMVADRDRGGAWTDAILGLCADEIHLCASPDAEGILTRMIAECGDTMRIVRHERMTPLVMEKARFSFPDSVRPGDALIVFAKARVHAVAAELRQAGFRVSLIYGALPPDVRRDQAERFRNGDTQVAVSTDAIAMGMNLPIKRVVFLESEKYDGDITRTLTDAEFKQIAGRAGRFGIYDTGYVNAFGFHRLVAHALEKELPPVTEAVVRFPGSLLGVPLPLTETIRQWMGMQDKGCFSKASTQRMMALAAMLETPETDKELLYRFVCIPFDETEQDLLERWRAMYRAEARGEHLDVLPALPEIIVPEACVTPMLDTLEADYRRCDLYYNYARLFLEEPDDVLAQIQQRKDLISRGIIHILSTQRLQEKRCPDCGRRLAWNWPHRLCDGCFQRQLRRRGHAGDW